MNLFQTMHLLEIKAGGPGSGRKPEVDHQHYGYVHGKTPSGHGAWAFGPKPDTDSTEAYFHTGKYTEAKKAAQKWGKSKGYSTIHVLP